MKAKICIEPNCKKKCRPHGRRCHHHNMQRYREKSPIRYIFQALKFNTIRRKGHCMFQLTLEEFTNFVIANPLYMEFKGRLKGSLQIDRIRNWEPYRIGNLQILKQADNIDKYWEQDVAAEQDHLMSITEDDMPF